jgi:hypothetical protein
MVDLESMIVVIIERNEKGKLSEDTLEIGIHFPPD